MPVDQQELEKQGVFQATSPLPSLVGDLDGISDMVAATKAEKSKQSKRAGWMMLIGLIGAGVCGVLGLTFFTVLFILAIFAGLIWWIYSLFSRGKLLEHLRRVEIAKERLAMLQQDALPDATFSLRLALASNPVKLSDEPWPARKNGKEQLFEEAWLSLQGPLLDGTVVNDEIKDLTRTRTYTNPRGKGKKKSRVTHLVNVRFSYPKDVYGDARPAQQALQGDLKLGSSAVLRSVRVTEKAVAMRALVSSESQIMPTAGMLSVGAYRILNLARRMAAAQGGKAQ